MVYEVGDCRLDIRIEQEPAAVKNVLIGQIADEQNPDRSMSNMPVRLMSGPKVLGRAVTNTSGEFLIEFSPRQSGVLILLLQSAGQKIEVKIDRLSEKNPDSD